MKKSVIKKLEQHAQTLKPIMEPKTLQMTGEEIKKAKLHKFDNKGKKIKNADVYTKITMQPVNHLTKLKAAYQRAGDAGIAEYSRWANETFNKQSKKKPVELQTI